MVTYLIHLQSPQQAGSTAEQSSNARAVNNVNILEHSEVHIFII